MGSRNEAGDVVRNRPGQINFAHCLEQGLQVAHGRSDDSDVARRISRAIVGHKLVELDYYKENEDEFSLRRVEPYALVNGREGWYVASFDPDRGEMRHFRLDRVRAARVTRERFEPRPGPLCGWCEYRERCPVFAPEVPVPRSLDRIPAAADLALAAVAPPPALPTQLSLFAR